MLTYNHTSISSRHESIDKRRLYFYEKGEEIPLTEQGVWQVYHGIAQLSQLSVNGEEVLLGWAQPSSFFGLWLTQVESYQAKALSELYLKWYSVDEIDTSPSLANLMLTQMVRRMRQTEALLVITGLRKVEERLKELLQLLKSQMGEKVEQGTRLIVRLTHQNLANAIGTTRVTITRLLGDFQRQGLIALDSDRHIIVLDH